MQTSYKCLVEKTFQIRTGKRIRKLGTMVDITDGKKLLLSNEEGGRVVVVTMANK